MANKTETVVVRLEKSLARDLKRIAREGGSNKSAEIRKAVEAHVHPSPNRDWYVAELMKDACAYVSEELRKQISELKSGDRVEKAVAAVLSAIPGDVLRKAIDPNNAMAYYNPNSYPNPESGTISYTYSNTSSGCSPGLGTVCTKIAPAPNALSGTGTVTTTYSYDNLDRSTRKTYSDGTTPTASFGYDADASTLTCSTVPSLTDLYPKSTRTGMCDGSGATAWAHDRMGRDTTEKRLINGSSAVTNLVQYSYNLDGSTATMTYPGSNRVITYAPNSSTGYTAGRPVSAVDTANAINYVTAAKYAPQGALASLTNGSSIAGALTYNSRLQPLQMYYTTGTISPSTLTQLQSNSCPTTVAAIMSTDYSFGLGANDNGNVQSITNCRSSNRSQNFTYDALNRIQTAYSSGPNWGESFGSTVAPGGVPSTAGIDPWGNLWERSPITGKTSYESLNAPATTKNQLTGFGYDIAGNLVSNGSATYVYDAEDRLISAGGYPGNANHDKRPQEIRANAFRDKHLKEIQKRAKQHRKDRRRKEKNKKKTERGKTSNSSDPGVANADQNDSK